MKYVKVVIDNVSDHTDTFYTYRCKYDEVNIGTVVKVPFGRGNSIKTAWIFEISEDSENIKRIKDVLEIDDSYTLPNDLIKLCIFIRNNYVCRYIDALKCIIPPGNGKKALRKYPYKDTGIKRDKIPLLTDEQAKVMEEITKLQRSEKYHAVLLNGVTGSGKTEIYLRVTASCLKEGKSVIMLVPEISLTPQIITRFIARFGEDEVAVFHSKLTKAQRYDQWMRVRKGESHILIGARSGIFAPFKNIGAIIIDEEHDASYKSDMTPKYDAIDLAISRAKECESLLLLGTATPSVTSAYRVKQGKYQKLQMLKRYNKTPLPTVEVVDMRKELKKGNRSILSRSLYDNICTMLKEGRQIILLLNRRGYSSFISCRTCGYVMKCDNCGISLTYHKSSGMAECHYCGKKIPIPKNCPSCSGKYIKHFGIGTEQVEEYITEIFPAYTVDRLDLDTISRKGEVERILKNFKRGKTEILVGTQLVAKGLDFSNVGLVGIIAADVTLNIPDYRSGERTFQLIVQASGRAGRGEKIGHVVIQTYNPDENAIVSAAKGDITGFIENELFIRKISAYPPFTDIIRLVFYGKTEDLTISEAEDVYKKIAGGIFVERGEVFKPQKAYMFKLNGEFRYHMIVKSPIEKTNMYLELIRNIKDIRKNKKNTKTVLVVEVNPYSFT